MATVDLREYLIAWQKGCRDGLTPEKAAASQRRRSFRPHRIVPRVYIGAQTDVRDTWGLYTRIQPDRLALIVCACARAPVVMLELRQTTTGSRGSRVLARCAWPELEERIAAGPLLVDWLAMALRSGSFGEKAEEEEEEEEEAKKNKKASRRPGGKVLFFRLCLPWEDNPLCAVREGLGPAVALMRAVVDGLGLAVVTHCVAGISRSVTLVCAFLLRCWCDSDATRTTAKGEVTVPTGGSEAAVPIDIVKAVVEFVREIRLCACPNPGFMLQLAEYADELLSSGK